MDKVSFEEASKVWAVSTDELRKAALSGKKGLNDLMANKRVELANVGWTDDELFKEAELRARQKAFAKK